MAFGKGTFRFTHPRLFEVANIAWWKFVVSAYPLRPLIFFRTHRDDVEVGHFALQSWAFRNGEHWLAGRPGPLGSWILGKLDVSFAWYFTLTRLGSVEQLLACCLSYRRKSHLWNFGEEAYFGAFADIRTVSTFRFARMRGGMNFCPVGENADKKLSCPKTYGADAGRLAGETLECFPLWLPLVGYLRR